MKALPFNTEMARAWHEGRKTVTRRLMKPQPQLLTMKWEWSGNDPEAWPEPGVWIPISPSGKFGLNYPPYYKPRYQPGEIVYIQEPWGVEPGRYIQPSIPYGYGGRFEDEIFYKADDPDLPGMLWRSPATMPERFSRSKARIVDVRVERVREITEKEINAEGIACSDCWTEGTPYRDFPHPEHCGCRSLWINCWNSLYPGSWKRNDWAWRLGLSPLWR
jgi:hypothetical protein